MSYLPNYNLSFIHVPKTGGNSLTSYFNKSQMSLFNIGHVSMKEIYYNSVQSHNWPENYRDLILNSFKFSIVRNPYQRVASYYAYCKKFENLKTSFDDFLEDIITLKNNSRASWPQSRFLFIDRDLSVNKVLYFENYQEDVGNLLSFFNIDSAHIPCKLKTNSSKIVNLTNSHRKKIYDFYEEDFVNFKFLKNI